jgi:murein DD-endopeptidase MepM/ murein hydrolase activator NlpD
VAVVIRTRRKPKGHKELFAAVALVAYLVQPGDTLSGIAASHGASLAAVEAANPQIANPNLIYAGQTVTVPGGSSAALADTAPGGASQGAPTQYSAPSSTASSTSSTSQASSGGSAGYAASSSGYSSGSLSDIPGVPQSFAACVAYRESTNLQNPAADGNAYGIIQASGYNVYGTSLANQKQVFTKLYQQYGTSPWAADGC